MENFTGGVNSGGDANSRFSETLPSLFFPYKLRAYIFPAFTIHLTDDSIVYFCINEWNNLDKNIRDLPSISLFKAALIKFLRPSANLVFSVTDNKGVVGTT